MFRLYYLLYTCSLNNIHRIDAGGKLLTNHLKEIISYRQLQVMDETYVMNQVSIGYLGTCKNWLNAARYLRVQHK